MHRVQISSFMPLPEVVLFNRELRQDLLFLGNRDELWSKFKECLARRINLETKTFINGHGLLKWTLKGPMLGMSVHQARISNDHRMKHRMPVPLIAKHAYHETFDSAEFHVVQEILVYPSLYAEVRRRITTSTQAKIPAELVKSQRDQLFNGLKETKHIISKALFGCKDQIRPSFSDCFQIDLIKSGKQDSSHSSFSIVSIQNNNHVTIEVGSQTSKLLMQRLCNAVFFAFAQRVVIPVLWHTVRDSDISHRRAIRELIECLFISHSSHHYVYSKKLTAHILPWSYQRRAFEKIADTIGLAKIELDLKKEFTDWLQQFQSKDVIFLAGCTEPLKSKLVPTINRLFQLPGMPKLDSPILNVFDYLVLAFLHDQLLMEEDPQRFRIAEDRMGVRTANQIHIGAQILEGRFPDRYTQPHEKTDIYPVPGKLLDSLKQLQLITTLASRKTSAKMTFRININNHQVIKYCIQIKKEFDNKDIREIDE